MSDFEAIGKAFIDFYYKKFDSGARDEVAALYEPVNGMMNFNHSTFAKGAQGIAEKLRSLTFQTIAHTISTLDIQPTYDNCILIVVTGALKADNDPPMSFTETFLLRFHNNSWLVVNNVFRLILQDLNQNSIIALLKGPDTRYKNILMKDGEQLIVPIVNDQCQDKNSFLQINIRSLSAKEQAQLLRKQYRQLYKHHYQSLKKKDKCLYFTFPITYPCPMKFKQKRSSIISNSSKTSRLSSFSFQQSLQKKLNNQYSNTMNRLKSAVSISFIDDKNDDISINKISQKNHSSSLLNIPSKNLSTNKFHSLNAYLEKHLCQLCGSILSNGICSCIVQYLLKLNKTKENDILVQLNGIFENLTSNNIIT